ncbi:MAG: thiamine-phosphate kinase [Chthoniobacterales bacterium]
MKLSGLSEEEIIHSLLKAVPYLKSAPAPLGDDCAVVRTKCKHSLSVYKTDCLIENVHFLQTQSAEKIGWKALCRVLSDFAAMGAHPHYALITIAAPPECDLEMLEGVYRGIGKAARKYKIVIAGGETARSPSQIFLSVAAIGTVRQKRLMTRSGGKKDDVLFVTGKLGGSIKGRHLTFTPRLDEGQWLAKQGFVHAIMDLSDGLASDLPRLADASGTGFEINLKHIPKMPGCSIENALKDGEDYELLFAVAPNAAKTLEKKWPNAFPKVKLTRIGVLTKNKTTRTEMGTGFQHF